MSYTPRTWRVLCHSIMEMGRCASVGECRVTLSDRLEHRQRHLALALVLPANAHPHPTLHRIDRIGHTNDVGHHAETFVQVNVREHIRPQLGKGRVAALHYDTKGIHGPLTLRNAPGSVERAAGCAMAPGI